MEKGRRDASALLLQETGGAGAEVVSKALRDSPDDHLGEGVTRWEDGDEERLEQELERVKLAARKHLAFYGSTPAYRPTLACHGWEDLHGELNRLSKQGRWDDMAGLVDDEILETLAVVGPRHEIAGRLRARLDGIADGVSLTHNRAPDPSHWADVVRDLRAMR